jgi:hypothetical protein
VFHIDRPFAAEEEAMAQPGYERPVPGDSAPKISGQKARQGQNVKGMIWVLIIGVVLVVAAYAVMLAMQSEPVAVDGRAMDDPAAQVAPTPGPGGPAPVTPETAQSPQ